MPAMTNSFGNDVSGDSLRNSDNEPNPVPTRGTLWEPATGHPGGAAAVVGTPSANSAADDAAKTSAPPRSLDPPPFVPARVGRRHSTRSFGSAGVGSASVDRDLDAWGAPDRAHGGGDALRRPRSARLRVFPRRAASPPLPVSGFPFPRGGCGDGATASSGRATPNAFGDTVAGPGTFAEWDLATANCSAASACGPSYGASVVEVKRVDGASKGPAFGGGRGGGRGDADDCGFVNNYEIIGELGRGAQGRVLLAVDDREAPFAIKVLKKGLQLRRRLPGPASAFASAVGAGRRGSCGGGGFGGGPESPIVSIVPTSPARPDAGAAMLGPEHEIAIMKKLKHKNIVRLHAVIDDDEEGVLYLVMQYVPRGAVASQRRDGSWPALPREAVQRHMRDVAAGLAYLHRHGILHRDIKPDNILVDDAGVAYLADFGISAIVSEAAGPEPGPLTSPRSAATGLGTPAFMAPEQHSARKGDPDPCSAASDVWALGVTLYLLLYGYAPFYGDTVRETITAVLTEALAFPPHATDGERDLLLRMLDKRAATRMTLRAFRHHPFVRGGGGAAGGSAVAGAAIGEATPPGSARFGGGVLPPACAAGGSGAGAMAPNGEGEVRSEDDFASSPDIWVDTSELAAAVLTAKVGIAVDGGALEAVGEQELC